MNRTIRLFTLVLLSGLVSQMGYTQATPDDGLPQAPTPNVDSQAVVNAAVLPGGNGKPQVNAMLPSRQQAQNPGSSSNIQKQMANPQAPMSTQNPTMKLTRAEAEQIALKNNPRISVGHLIALAQHQVYRETRAGELPNFNGVATAVDAREGSRIGAGPINAPRLLVHAGAGVTLTQLVTDFGRTLNLVSSSKLTEKAQNANALATVEDIILATDQAFYDMLQAQALLKVAQQTVAERQTVQSQVNELTKNKLKSTLDLSFANVNLAQAKLLQLDAENNVESTTAALTAILGYDHRIKFELVEEDQQLPAPPPDSDVLINLALKQRPDLMALTYNQQAAEKFRKAQRDQLFPTISAEGLMGGTPVRPDCFGGCVVGAASPNYFNSSWYGAMGVNMTVPIFDGFLYTAQASEAKFRAQAAAEDTRNLRDNVVRDVRTAWLNTQTAFQRVGVTEELVKEADLSLTLSQSRYQLGLGSIVELSQAQMNQADAAISYVNAKYQYKLSLSTLNFEIGTQP